MLPSSVDKPRESLAQNLIKKSKQQPLVPLFAVLTCGALYLSGKAIRQNNARLANRMFYWRVGFQALTLGALIGGAYYYNDTDVGGFKGTPQEMLLKKSKEREQLWIEELERIDRESKKIVESKKTESAELDNGSIEKQ
ncbi:Rcf1 protein [Starmerella bacillaris]|uniref:Respiratory supercomplex factor 1, mitochondrial n=1 Tax=Starmerella bacillaris TaxID=1247836 RepID=A0AAV5RLF8_STABA|nr:Rcf1 protein [Starmerella bacillaris]